MTNTQPKCRACGAISVNFSKGQVLDQIIQYEECTICGYVQTEEPYWLERAYEEAINTSDTGIMLRNLSNARIVISTLFMFGHLHGRVVDAAGGLGILVRLLRDYGVDAYWSDPYCQNLLARGFEHDGETADLVTAFEVFEHFVKPPEELDRLLSIAPNVLLSTNIIPEPTPLPGSWWYYGPEHGQHIGFYKVKTLQKLAEERGKHLVTNGTSYHLVTDKPKNSVAWKILLRSNRIISSVVKWRLQSKTWDDHLAIGESQKDRRS